ncbi:MAG: 3-oxoacid CoA-transferase, partial [Clostridia bacterium]|nr:3-oxoacid CoA-transferase [Clostridia bacterium]
MPDYNTMELMICLASRYLEDGSIVVVGTGAPCAAAMLAQKVSAPNLIIMFEAGGMGPVLPTMPISVGDSRTFHKAIAASSMPDVMDACQRGMVDYTFLGGAQIDPYGNLNSTVIGPHARPKVRMPGSGGACDLASLCWRTMVMTVQNKRRFVEKCDFITTPGYLTGPGAREAAGLPPGTGPYKVITNLAVIGYDEKTCRMKVESIHPGVT